MKLKPQTPAVQVGIVPGGPVGHTVPHPPQLLGSVLRLASQPSLLTPLQLAQPKVPPGAGEMQMKPHVPLTQVALALGGGGHTLPQAPQLFASFVRSTHVPPPSGPAPQLVWPAAQEPAQKPLAQPAVPPAGARHTWPQAPQLLGSDTLRH
jgi:hypothetical protein